MKKNLFLRIFEFFYGLPMFFVNVWKFKKELYLFRWWDYGHTLYMFRRCVIEMRNGKQTLSNEPEETRKIKIEQMNRVIQILDNIEKDYYLSKAEEELGEILFTTLDQVDADKVSHNSKVFDRAAQLEDEEFDELWNILKGDYNHDKQMLAHNGSGLKTWWD